MLHRQVNSQLFTIFIRLAPSPTCYLLLDGIFLKCCSKNLVCTFQPFKLTEWGGWIVCVYSLSLRLTKHEHSLISFYSNYFMVRLIRIQFRLASITASLTRNGMFETSFVLLVKQHIII